MNPKIKQQPFEKYPKLAEHLEFAANNWTVDTVHWNGLLEEINNVVSGAEYGYNIKESVDKCSCCHELINGQLFCIDCFQNNIKESVNEKLLTDEQIQQAENRKSEAIEFAEWLSLNEWVKRIHTHPNKVGQYYSHKHCEYKPIEQLFDLFLQQQKQE